MALSDPVIDEIHAIRKKLLEEAGGTLEGLVASIQDAERKSNRRLLDPAVLRQEREQQDREQAQQSPIVLPISTPASDQTIVAE
jgi:hypothetical protein